MQADLIFVPVLAVYIALLLALFVYGINFLYMTVVALLTTERRPASIVPASWPDVTIQLPLYNELYVVRRLIDAVATIDYPVERLEIQVLDDSTDDTSGIIAECVQQWRDRGVDIRHIQRSRRDGYKAGALRHGLESARGSLIAIFDADFVPQRNFLRQAVPPLLADPELAFVQARWDHLNRRFSLLTQLQAIAIDGHFTMEQAGRWAGGNWFNFNGSAGVWRRAALMDAGGWQADTLTEDLDVSYRAFIAGWRASYLGHVEAPAELPVSFSAFRRQQHRWARGSFECAVKHLPTIWHSKATLFRKVSATLHLTGYSIHLLLLSLSLLYPLILFVSGTYPELVVLLGLLNIFNLTTLAPTFLYTMGQRRLSRSWLRQMPIVLLLSVFGAGMMVNTARAAGQAFWGRPAPFERTAKFGVSDTRQDWFRLRYQVGLDWIVIVELGLAMLNLATCAVAIERQSWTIAIYAGISGVGLASTVIATVRQSVRIILGRRASNASEVATAPV